MGTAYFGGVEMTKRRWRDDVDFDFETHRDRLARDERTWLRDSISIVCPNNPAAGTAIGRGPGPRTRTRT